MPPVNISSLLSYGAIGLGCALALLAFWLLQKEQKIKAPRKEMLKAIYVFMTFALVLALTGFIAEFLKADRERAYTLASQNGQAVQKLKSSSQQLRSLMSIKGEQIGRIRSVCADESGTQRSAETVGDLERTIRSIDMQINETIKDLNTPPP